MNLQEYRSAYEDIYALTSESHEYIAYGPNYYSANRRLKSISKEISRLNPKLLLDVGCGDGIYAIICAQKGTSYIGIDISRHNLQRTKTWSRRKKLDKLVDLVLCDASTLPFKSNSVETLLCSEVLEHLLDFKQVLNEMARVVQRDLIVSVPCFGALAVDNLIGNKFALHATERTRNFISRETYKGIIALKANGAAHINFFTASILRKELSESGFVVIRVRGSGFDLPLFSNSAKHENFIIAKATEILEDHILSRLLIFNLSPFLSAGNDTIIMVCEVHSERRN
jgi:ubiquinone/menaquinone biosynthesis C-methylase UbiE